MKGRFIISAFSFTPSGRGGGGGLDAFQESLALWALLAGALIGRGSITPGDWGNTSLQVSAAAGEASVSSRRSRTTTSDGGFMEILFKFQAGK